MPRSSNPRHGRPCDSSSAAGLSPTSLTAVLGVALALCCAGFPVHAQEDGYRASWERGAYSTALDELQLEIEEAEGYAPIRLIRHRAELRFAIGLVDEAIVDLEFVADQYPEPAHSLHLALMYRYRGRKEEYEKTLKLASRQMRGRRWRYSRRDENLVAMGRILELLGENPKTLLDTHYGFILNQDPGLVSALVAAGDLAYRRSGYDVASKHYAQALEYEPNNQDALAGLCECYWKSSDGRLQPSLESLLQLNPNHPRARAIRIEQYLDLGKNDEALKLIEKALAINPVSLRFRSLKSAAYFALGREDEMKVLWDEVLAFNPHCSELYRTTGRIASRHYRFKEGAELQRQALALDQHDHEAQAFRTLDLMRLGDETEGREVLEMAFEEDPYNVHLYNLLQLMDTLATFDTIERGAFTLRLPGYEAPVIADDALGLLDEAIGIFEAKYDVDLEKPVLIEMFDDHDDFMVRSVGLPGNVGHLGICFGKVVTLDSPSARPRGSWNWRSVLWHEFVHVITLQKTKNRMPRWLSEGISVYEEGQRSSAWHSRLDMDFRTILASEEPPRVEEIGALFTQPRTANHLMFGYFVAGEFVEHYVEAYGFHSLVASLEAIGQGERAVDALRRAADLSLKKLNRGFRAHLEKRFEPFDNLPAIPKTPSSFFDVLGGLLQGGEKDPSPHPDEPVEIAPQSSPFTDAMDTAKEAFEAEDWDAAEEAFNRAYGLFPDYTGRESPLRYLARIYEEKGDREAQKETLDRIVHSSPEELEACRRLVEFRQNDRDWDRVAWAANWALGIDPYDIEMRQALSQAQLNLGRESEALGSLAILAHLDSGHATEHRARRIEVLTKLGRHEQGKREVLELLEEVPHYWRAQRLLLSIVEEGGNDS